MIEVEQIDYPKIYIESDKCAIDNQKKYFRLFKLKIVLPLLVSIVGSFSINQIFGVVGFDFIIAIILLGLMVLTAIIELRRFDKTWFASRAVAETVKKESWLFMMKANPYNTTEMKTSFTVFLTNLRNILKAQSQICSELSTHIQVAPQITKSMKQIRNGSVAERMDHYIKYRLHYEARWYANRSKQNKRLEFKWFILTWVFQFLAVSLAFIVLFLDNPIVNPVGIMTTTAVVIISWMSVKSYRVLSQSYGLILQDLSLLEAKAKNIPPKTEEELDEFVVEVERTISREHTMWINRNM